MKAPRNVNWLVVDLSRTEHEHVAAPSACNKRKMCPDCPLRAADPFVKKIFQFHERDTGFPGATSFTAEFLSNTFTAAGWLLSCAGQDTQPGIAQRACACFSFCIRPRRPTGARVRHDSGRISAWTTFCDLLRTIAHQRYKMRSLL